MRSRQYVIELKRAKVTQIYRVYADRSVEFGHRVHRDFVRADPNHQHTRTFTAHMLQMARSFGNYPRREWL